MRLTLSKNMTHNMVKETITKGLMEVLFDMYEKHSTNNKVYLMKTLFNLKMREGAPMVENLNEFNTIINQLSLVEINFHYEVCTVILLASIPSSWEPMRVVVRYSIGNSKLKLNDVRDQILPKKVHMKDFR